MCVGFALPCACVCVCMCVHAQACGNYSYPNADSAGETGCLLINEQSRWPWVGGSHELHTSEASQVVRVAPAPGLSDKHNTLVGYAQAVCVWPLVTA